jgi:hypothetical protein
MKDRYKLHLDGSRTMVRVEDIRLPDPYTVGDWVVVHKELIDALGFSGAIGKDEPGLVIGYGRADDSERLLYICSPASLVKLYISNFEADPLGREEAGA